MKWYRKVSQNTDNADVLMAALDYFESEYEIAKSELNVKGKRIEEVARMIPGMVEYRFGQLQEIEAILSLFELNAEKAVSDAKKRYLENYQRNLSDRTAEKYAETDDDVIARKLIIIEVARVRNLFLSITKGLEYLHFQLSNVTRLRQAGIEDATF